MIWLIFAENKTKWSAEWKRLTKKLGDVTWRADK
jgi:hypothetical protein